MKRREFVLAGVGLGAWARFGALAAQNPPAPGAADGTPFDGTTVRQLARQRAQAPYKAFESSLPDEWTKLSYDAYRALRFRPEHALWRDAGLPFQVQFFHRGFIFHDRVDIHEVSQGKARPIRYSPELFSFGETPPPKPDADLGFAGFRLHAKLNRPDYYDEVAVFLGASYFRAVAKGQVLGLSARGLSIATGDAKGEEFPAFRAFWIERPTPGAQSIVVHALLDSPSTTAAYRFTVRPGETTVIDVEAALYPRTKIEQAGLGTLTSMFYFDAQDRSGIDDFRPAVHDSSGLAIHTGHGERLWRPLANPRSLQVSGFADANVRGFGLLQRNRDFRAFEDLEARYEKRPNAWVEPIGDWGEGEVQLFEIPAQNEYNDNIVAYWRPKEAFQAKREYIYTYRLHWTGNDPSAADTAVFLRTRQGSGSDGRRRFVLDAVGEALKKLPPEAEVRGDVSAGSGKILHVVTQPNPHTGGWRLSFQLDPEKADSVDLRARLVHGDAGISETWIYRWTPP
ncbi:MAG TPA: glucan biosynthesis protein G [Zeimonas sp.]|nr:glucan biosynthesis protein G [Zeimonas sp.]